MNRTNFTSALVALTIIFCALFENCLAQVEVEEGFENVIDLSPPATTGPILNSGWVGQLRSFPTGFTGVFQGAAQSPDKGGLGFGAHGGSPNSYMGASFTSAGSFTQNDLISTWMISPTIEFQNGQTFSFYTRTTASSQFPDRLYVRLSLNGDSTNVGNNPVTVGDFTTELLAINPLLFEGDYPEDWTRFEFEITGISQPTEGRFAFHYFIEDLSMNANVVAIDSVTYIASTTCTKGDVNFDSMVTLLDVQPFVDLIIEQIYLCEGDINNDGQVDLLDVGPLVDILAGN